MVILACAMPKYFVTLNNLERHQYYSRWGLWVGIELATLNHGDMLQLHEGSLSLDSDPTVSAALLRERWAHVMWAQMLLLRKPDSGRFELWWSCVCRCVPSRFMSCNWISVISRRRMVQRMLWSLIIHHHHFTLSAVYIIMIFLKNCYISA